jgi:flagellar motor switch protein FliM
VQTGDRDEKLAARWADQLREAVSDAELQLVAQLATLRVSALDLATIKAGDTLWFKPPPSVKVLVQSAHLFDAEYGTADNSVAVRIDRIIEPPAAAHESDEVSHGSSSEEHGSEASAVGNKARRGSASSKRMAGVSAA